MNENIDLTKILKDCPKGWKFWSPIFGKVEFEQIFKLKGFVNVKKDKESWSFYSDATFPFNDIKSVEIMLYPSEDQHDWSKFTAPWYKKEKFDPKTLNAFDKVLAKDFDETSYWTCNLFSHYNKNKGFYYCSSVPFDVCIPYNDDTKHLIGTTEEAPEFYRYWED